MPSEPSKKKTVVQTGLRPAAFGAVGYRCIGGPADGDALMLCDGDVIVIGRQPAGVNPGDPFIALTLPPTAAAAMRLLSTYRGEYELRDGALHWSEDHRLPPSECRV